MQLKTIQWNIGGGKIRSQESDPALSASYCHDNLGYIIDFLLLENPDIVTLQETHADALGSQAQVIAEALGYAYFFNDEYADSHLADGQRLSQSVISRFPIENHQFSLFYNPHYTIRGEDGTEWISHDKGISTCDIVVSESLCIKVQTLHLIPFGLFTVDACGQNAKQVRDDVSEKINTHSIPYLLQGDFNYDNESLVDFLPDVVRNTDEIKLSTGTTPKGRKYDHVAFRGLTMHDFHIADKALTDHYPIVAVFDVFCR